MSCNHPYKAFLTGFPTENGKDDFILVRDDAPNGLLDVCRAKKPVNLATAPHCVINGHTFLCDPVSIPCGVCVACRIDRAREWKIRNCLELIDNPEAYFVTLTYKDGCLTFDDSGYAVLNKRDLQLFFKRLRNAIGSFRYFGCGEYGDEKYTARPHYHFIIYGHLSDFRLIGVNKFTSDAVSRCWPFGHSVIETVSPGSIAYVSGYVEKKFKTDYEKFSVKPFLVMSRRPGIGMMYFEKHKDRFEHDMHVYGIFNESRKGSSSTVPKAFRRKLQDLPWYEDWKATAIKAGESMEDTMAVVYRLSDPTARHFAQDAALEDKLTKVRKITL